MILGKILPKARYDDPRQDSTAPGPSKFRVFHFLRLKDGKRCGLGLTLSPATDSPTSPDLEDGQVV